MTAVPPTLSEVRERLRLPEATVTDVELADALDAELESQTKSCRVDPYAAPLRAAVFRRVARALAAKGVPLGILADEFGSSTLHATDAEIIRLEGPYMRFELGSPPAAEPEPADR